MICMKVGRSHARASGLKCHSAVREQDGVKAATAVKGVPRGPAFWGEQAGLKCVSDSICGFKLRGLSLCLGRGLKQEICSSRLSL